MDSQRPTIGDRVRYETNAPNLADYNAKVIDISGEYAEVEPEQGYNAPTHQMLPIARLRVLEEQHPDGENFSYEVDKLEKAVAAAIADNAESFEETTDIEVETIEVHSADPLNERTYSFNFAFNRL